GVEGSIQGLDVRANAAFKQGFRLPGAGLAMLSAAARVEVRIEIGVILRIDQLFVAQGVMHEHQVAGGAGIEEAHAVAQGVLRARSGSAQSSATPIAASAATPLRSRARG